MPQPGQFNPPGEDWIGRKLAELEKQIRELRAANVFGLTGITPQDGGTDFDGFVNVNGEMTVDGDSVFNGALSILGPLTLKPGSIQNDALTNPFSPGSAGLSQTNFATTTGGNVRAQQTITVPAGFTQCMVLNGVSAGSWNNTTAGDYIYVSADIDGTNGGETAQFASGPGFGSASAFAIRTLTGLTGGGTFTVGTRIRTGAAWAASTSAFANTNAIALFIR